MDDLLFLAHRIPYPPNKGDKLRSYHVLKHLAKRYRVHVGTFVDDPADWQHVDTVKAVCRRRDAVPAAVAARARELAQRARPRDRRRRSRCRTTATRG